MLINRLATQISTFGAASGGGEHVGQGGGELGDVNRTGGIHLSNRAAPEGAGWFTPQLFVAGGGVKVAGVTLVGAGLVRGFGQIQRNGAVHLDELSGKRSRQQGRVVKPRAVEHCPGAVMGGAQRREHGGLAEPLRLCHRLRAAQAIHQGFLDLVFG